MRRDLSGSRVLRAGVVIAFAALIAVLTAVIVWAHPDTAASAPLRIGVSSDFGQDGTLVVPASAGIDNWAYGFQAAPLPDDGLVVAGDKEVLSVGPEGEPRASFGKEGIKRIGPNDGRRIEIEDVATDDLGRIVLFGGATRPEDEIGTHGGRSPDQAVIERLLPDGGYDPAFGGDGVVRSTFGYSARRYGGTYMSADFGVVDTQGRPLFTLPASHPGETCDTHQPVEEGDESRIVRLDADGGPDPTFDGDAISGPFLRGAADRSLELLPDGGTEVVAIADVAGCLPHQLLIQRRLADGRPDPLFGPEGVRSYPTLRAGAVAADPGGGLVVLSGGPYRPRSGERTARIERLTPGGAIDRHFGDRGAATVSLPGSRSHIRCLLTDDRGRIYVIGTRMRSHGRLTLRTGSELVALRLTPDGRPDRSFGEGRLAAASFPGLLVVAKTAVLSGPRLVVVGTGHPVSKGSSPADLVLAAFKE